VGFHVTGEEIHVLVAPYPSVDEADRLLVHLTGAVKIVGGASGSPFFYYLLRLKIIALKEYTF
jgi:hypothetical protein